MIENFLKNYNAVYLEKNLSGHVRIILFFGIYWMYRDQT